MEREVAHISQGDLICQWGTDTYVVVLGTNRCNGEQYIISLPDSTTLVLRPVLTTLRKKYDHIRANSVTPLQAVEHTSF